MSSKAPAHADAALDREAWTHLRCAETEDHRGAAIVSLDQPSPPESWRWAGPSWHEFASNPGASKIVEVVVGARDPAAMARRWSEVLGTEAPVDDRIAISAGALRFVRAPVDVIVECRLEGSASAPVASTICGTRFRVSKA
ncbi:MAG TPA: hypothetical protein VHC69_25695 [Polyangiaceae bacterium]|nr:hypothetical protein [Polyangiaceae bacterium]